MKITSLLFYFIVLILLILGISMIVGYNRIVEKAEMTEIALADIDAIIQRKAELLPNFVTQVKTYVSGEESLSEKVKEAKDLVIVSNSIEEKSSANANLSLLLNDITKQLDEWYVASGDVFSGEEVYPFIHDLEYVEEKLQENKETYNQYVKEYNITMHKFPNNLISNFFSFEEKKYFETTSYFKEQLEKTLKHMEVEEELNPQEIEG